MRGDLLPTPARRALIGLQPTPTCPSCPADIGTLAHCLQICPRTHGSRIWRHDYILGYLISTLRRRGKALGCPLEITSEPRIPVGTSFLKPDLVFWFKGLFPSKAWVLDAHVCSVEINPNQAHQDKVTKYNIEEVRQWVKQKAQVEQVECTAIGINRRGGWSATSADFVRDNFGLRNRDIAIMGLRTVLGGHRAWRFWSRHGGRPPDRRRRE